MEREMGCMSVCGKEEDHEMFSCHFCCFFDGVMCFALHAEVERATFICNFGLSNDVYTLANSVIFPIFVWYDSNDITTSTYSK